MRGNNEKVMTMKDFIVTGPFNEDEYNELLRQAVG